MIDDDFEIEDNVIEQDQAPNKPVNVLHAPPREQIVADGQRFEQRRFTGGDTLDEPVTTTIMRDIKLFGRLLLQTVGFQQKETATNREWDLWGPLIFCLLISVVLSIHLGQKRSQTFSIIFSLIWLGQATITSNIKLLGGTISYLHALSITGYSLFPLLIAAIFSRLVSYKLIRIPISLISVFWSAWCARRGLGFAGVQKSRLFLAIYPLGLFYFALGWLCILA